MPHPQKQTRPAFAHGIVSRCNGLRLILASLLFCFASSTAAGLRILLIGVDAIGYDVIAGLTDPALGGRALFKGMRRPIAVVNAFPGGSYVAWTGLLKPLGSPKALGYEACYFDRADSQMHGCYSLIKVPAPWRDLFEWSLEGLPRKLVAYGWPESYSRAEIEEGLSAFVGSDKDFFSMYIVSTDALGHIAGPEAQAEFLRALDKALGSLRSEQAHRPFHVVIVTDHGVAGGQPLKNTWRPIAAVLAKAGFELANAIMKELDVTIVKYGLLSAFVGFTWRGKEQEVASLVSSVPGVDLCVVPQFGGWKIMSVRGEALIGRRRGGGEPLWSYQILIGDPLDYAPILERLRRRTGNDKEEWFPESWWFEASKRHFYPDALYRLAAGFELVENAASLVCSNSPGYMFGSPLTELVARPTVGELKWTHGALYRDASLGFLLTDMPTWPDIDVVRYDQGLAPLADFAASALATRASAVLPRGASIDR
jgi:hypothetical protein